MLIPWNVTKQCSHFFSLWVFADDIHSSLYLQFLQQVLEEASEPADDFGEVNVPLCSTLSPTPAVDEVSFPDLTTATSPTQPLVSSTALSHCRHCHPPHNCPDTANVATQTMAASPPSGSRTKISSSLFQERRNVSGYASAIGTTEEEVPSSPFAADDDDDDDDDYVPGMHSTSSDTAEETEEEEEVEVEEDFTSTVPSDPVNGRKYVVWGEKLEELFVSCRQCHSPLVSRKRSEKGSLLTVTTVCQNGHRLQWHSQPSYGRGNSRTGAGTWLMSAAIILAGGLFSTFSLFCHTINLCFVSRSTFFDVQSKFICPVINKAWLDHVLGLHVLLRGATINISGDGRCDSPGYSAKYGT